MNYRDLILHLTVGDPAELPGQIDYAAAMAKHCGAHLTGLFTTPRLPLAYHYIPTAVIQEHAANAKMVASTARQLFDAAIGRHGVGGEWIEVQGGSLEAIQLHARTADLLLVGQPATTSDPILGQEYGAELLRHDVALGLGRPIMVLPAGALPGQIGQRILIGWNASREASRAVHDALPLLQTAKMVTVLCVGTGQDYGLHGERLVKHLGRHGIAAELILRPGSDADAGEILLAEAERLATDLIVMGAYGHVRWREVVFGGATEMMLEMARLPVLFSH